VTWDERADDLPTEQASDDDTRLPLGAAALPAPRHTFIYLGWRGQLQAICDKTRLDFVRVAYDLGVSPDRSGEEVARFHLGWL